mmetsp:Transcript_372/g.1277  ORF Transcript_372/g.1277 Transcript_372/m.1277 type:complete len:577 (-) Transcript_372:147-1877(-)
MPSHYESSCGTAGRELEVETMSAGRAALGEGGGALWQNGRFQQRYDKVGQCLGIGGMGGVWAARVGDSVVHTGYNSPRRSSGTWVAVKAIPIQLFEGERAAESLHAGLRECLSTFRDLSPVHVVSYDNFWLEEPQLLSMEMRELCVQRGGWKPDIPLGDAKSREAASINDLARQLSEASECGARADPKLRVESLRFNDECDVCAVLSSRLPMTPASNFGESCGFVWESSDTPSQSGLRRATSRSWLQDEVEAARSFQLSMNKRVEAVESCSTCVVLLIEMELMGPQPKELDFPGTEEVLGETCRSTIIENRLTLRAWLQRPARTFAAAADVFGPLMMSVRHIHRKRLIHSDLKPDNIFITENIFVTEKSSEKRDAGDSRARIVAVRIGDFGLAGEIPRENVQTAHGLLRKSLATGGTPGYAAPELSKRSGPPTDKNDIFACAVILLELLLPPFRTHMEFVEELKNFTTGKALPVHIRTRLPKTRTLLHEMGEQDPMMRLSAEEVYKKFDKEVRKELLRSKDQDCELAASMASAPEKVEALRSKPTQLAPSNGKVPVRSEHPAPKGAPRHARRRQKG